MVRQEIVRILETLSKDREIWAVAPCGHEYRLSDSEIFYGEDLTPSAKAFVKSVEEELADLRDEVKDLEYKLTAGFTKKSVEVKLGKTVEKICAVFPGFPYVPSDCRALFDPIDYLAFKGLKGGSISQLDFVDVKTGRARLNDVQKEIRDAVDDGKVRVKGIG